MRVSPLPSAAMTVRTRFAPSPTGYLHIGGARTALFAWAYARRHDGQFILRIEDTDVARSTPAAVQAILDGMQWLGLAHDEGPYYQMQRMPRYKEVIGQMLAAGSAYYCCTSPGELEQLREAQMAKKEKPRYDGRWRPEAGKVLPTPPAGVSPVVRFRNPLDGTVAWDDGVKGITHVIRGDDHVNNTPRQINVLRALGAQVPQYAHLSMILGDDGTKLSKRHGAVSVMQYEEDGYLPEAVLNYLARLGWSHGDEEVFSMAQFVEWFDLDHITSSAAQFNTEKLNWLNAHYLKAADNGRLAADAATRLARRGIDPEAGVPLEKSVALYKDRVANLNELADAVEPFCLVVHPSQELVAAHLTDAARAALKVLRDKLAGCLWEKAAISAAIKETLAACGLKMPQVAIPLRVVLLGQPQSPSIDAVLEVLGRDEVLSRLDRY